MSIDNASPSEWKEAYTKRLEKSWAAQRGENWLDPIENTRPTLPEIIGNKLRETQVGGDHYKGKVEPWDVMIEWGLDPWLANVIKYVQRHRKKAGKEDLEKAKHYLEYAIANYDTISTKYYK
jgi:hypothetical protein